MTPSKKKKTPSDTSLNTNDEPEASQTPEILDIPEDNDPEDDAEETPSPEDDEPTPMNTELFQLLQEMHAEFRRKDHLIEDLHQDNPVTVRELKVSEPPEFHGKISEYGIFMSQCLLIFTLCPRFYAKDK